MIKVKIKRQTRQNGQAFTITQPCSTLQNKVPLLFPLFGNNTFQAPPPVITYLVRFWTIHFQIV